MPFLQQIARGPLWRDFESSSRTALSLDASLCALNPAFITKGLIGRHHRAVSRNGLVLLMTPRPLAELEGAHVRLRLSVWHRSPLLGESAKPWGILLAAQAFHATGTASTSQTILRTGIAQRHLADAALSIDLGAERILNFVG